MSDLRHSERIEDAEDAVEKRIGRHVNSGERENAIVSARVGTNAELIADAVELYFEPGWTVADVTFGQGVFWKNVDTTRFDFLATDVADDGVDLRALPYETDSLDALVLDPPYKPSHDGRAIREYEAAYRLSEGPRSTASVHALYAGGIIEAARVVKRGGVLLVKCQDGIEANRRHWTHIAVREIAESVGFGAEDLLVLVQSGGPFTRQKAQVHTRANHSYLWVFRRKYGPW